MKKSFLNSLLIAIVAVIGLATIQSCVKDEKEIPKTELTAQKSSEEIQKLKAHLAGIAGVKAADVHFDEKRKMFMLFGSDQITFEELNVLYQKSLKK